MPRAGKVHRPLPQPPISSIATEAPPPSRLPEAPPPYSTVSSISSASPQKGGCGCFSFEKIWTSFIEGLSAILKSFLSLFQKKKPDRPREEGQPVSVRPRSIQPRVKSQLGIGKVQPFIFDESPELAYVVQLKGDEELELLGLHLVVKKEGEEPQYKPFGELEGNERNVALKARTHILWNKEKKPFENMLARIEAWARENRFGGQLVRHIDKDDVLFISEFALLGFEVHDNPSTFLEDFNKDLQTFRTRLESFLFTPQHRSKSFLLHRFTKKEEEDVLRFKRMLEYYYDADTVKSIQPNQLHTYWVFWDWEKEHPFRPMHQISINLDQGEVVPPELFLGMSVIKNVFEVDP